MIRARAIGLPARLSPTDLELFAGSLTAVIGPNGSGKTSLLRALAAVEGARGDVIVDGEPLQEATMARRSKLVGLLPSSRDLPWPIPVSDVLALGLADPDAQRLDMLVEALELEEYLRRPVTSLSTGERARVMFARCLMARPKLLLLDEPLAHLDPYWVLRFLDLIEGEADGGACVVVALHELDRLPRFTRVLLLDRGRLRKDQTPGQLFADPAFEEIFRVSAEAALVRKPADPRSSP